MPDRFLDLTDGVAMIVTDLHGDCDAFDRYIDRFRSLYEAGEAQRLIFLGDIIHGYGSAQTDDSLNMILDVIALHAEFGPDTVIMLLGNHEMPHIYGVSLAKGDMIFTPRFEHALGDHRQRIISFFESLPFYVRTAAGVMLSHAGPAFDIAEHIELLRTFDHQALLQETETALEQTPDITTLYNQYSAIFEAPYAEEAAYYLAITGPDDPRYSHLLRSFIISEKNEPFQILWNTLFTQNERGLTELNYLQATQQFLSDFSVGAPEEQRVMVSGHIVTPLGGYMMVNRYHLRLSSAAHARPREEGRYLLLDCAQPIRAANELLGGLGNVFEDEEQFA